MKKTLIYVAIASIVLLFIGIGTLTVLESLESKAEIESDQPPDKETIAESTEKMEGLEFAQTVPDDASEQDLLAMMHKMTHQKVIASEKWGLIRMNDASIAKAKQILLNSNYNSKENLLKIVEKWEKDDFGQVDEDHNYIWNLQGGSIGRAMGILSEQQEEEFIRNNFSE